MNIKYDTLIDFLKCPVLYKFKNEDNIKLNKMMGRDYLEKSLINAIYFFYNIIQDEQRIPAERELLNYWSKLYVDKKDDLIFSNSNIERRQVDYCHEFLKKFYIKYGKNPGIPVGVNIPFDIQVGSHKIIDGNIQLILARDEKVDIIYFDNSMNLPDDFRQANDIMFTLIAYAFRTIFGQKENRFIYNHVRKGTEIDVHRSQADFNKAIRMLDNIGQAIEQGLYWQRISYLCKNCPYSELCTEWDGR